MGNSNHTTKHKITAQLKETETKKSNSIFFFSFLICIDISMSVDHVSPFSNYRAFPLFMLHLSKSPKQTSNRILAPFSSFCFQKKKPEKQSCRTKLTSEPTEITRTSKNEHRKKKKTKKQKWKNKKKIKKIEKYLQKLKGLRVFL